MTSLTDDVHLASQIAEQIIAAGIDEDDEHFADLLASETDVQDRLRRIVRASRYIANDAKALGEMIGEMRERKARLERKAEGLRGAVAWAMGECALKRLNAPDFTATLAAGKPKVIVTDEAALPDDVCVLKREPSKTAIAAWIADKPCPGAEMSNGGPSLTVRVR